MKILYGMGNRYGGSIYLSRFLSNLDKRHEVKIASWYRGTYTIKTVDWILDGLSFSVTHGDSVRKLDIQKYFGYYVYNHHMPQFIGDLVKFEPDLVISDDEIFTSCFANSYNIPLWYCSPLSVYWGTKRENSFHYYQKYILTKYYNSSMRDKFPIPQKNLIYHPFCDMKFRPILREGFEWVKPYYNKIENNEEIYDSMFICHDLEREQVLSQLFNTVDNSVFASYSKFDLSNIKTCRIESDEYKQYLSQSKRFVITGDTSHLADTFYTGKQISICPTVVAKKSDVKTIQRYIDKDSLINAVLLKNYKIGTDYGQIEFMDNFAEDELKKKANPGDEFIIEKLKPHRLEGGDDNAQVLEIAYGNFDENDIIRLEDKYGRA